MGRWADQEADSERLPEGFQRVGYDADDQSYTFRDDNGAYWKSRPGNRYGTLYPTGDVDEEFIQEQAARKKAASKRDNDEGRYPLTGQQIAARTARRARRRAVGEEPYAFEEASNFQAAKMMLPFVLLVLVFLLVLFKFLMSASADDAEPQIHCLDTLKKVEVQKGDTCWKIATAHGLKTGEELMELAGNANVNCDALRVGQKICVPK